MVKGDNLILDLIGVILITATPILLVYFYFKTNKTFKQKVKPTLYVIKCNKYLKGE